MDNLSEKTFPSFFSLKWITAQQECISKWHVQRMLPNGFTLKQCNLCTTHSNLISQSVPILSAFSYPLILQWILNPSHSQHNYVKTQQDVHCFSYSKSWTELTLHIDYSNFSFFPERYLMVPSSRPQCVITFLPSVVQHCLFVWAIWSNSFCLLILKLTRHIPWGIDYIYNSGAQRNLNTRSIKCTKYITQLFQVPCCVCNCPLFCH